MSSFGGVFALESDRDVPASVAAELRHSVSRDPSSPPEIIQGPGYTAAFVDFGLLPGRGDVVDPGGARTILAGDPLLSPRSEGSRHDDLRKLHDAWLRDDESMFVRTRGTFCLVQIDPVRGILRLAMDRLGARPLFVAFQDGLVYFATSMRVLESLSALRLTEDIRGLVETIGFGYPLATRTRYEGVELLDVAEIVTARRGVGIQRRRYWNWSDMTDAGLQEPQLRERLFETFHDAVRWRLGNDRSVPAYLSGGMDSRVVVTSLRALGAEVHSITFGPDSALDFNLARLIAKHLGTRHHEFAKAPDNVLDHTAQQHNAWLANLSKNDAPPYPRAVWTGNGGSVGMGHVYLTEPMIALMRQGRLLEGVTAFIRRNRIVVSASPFHRRIRGAVRGYCLEGMLDAVRNMYSFDEGRRLYLFLMLNDQRRHLATKFEDIDRSCLEYINPFFDPTFVEVVMCARLDPFMGHRLYNRWLKNFPMAIDTVPWQAYPEHEPCPLPMPEGLSTQWEASFLSPEADAEKRRRALEQSAAALASPYFPRHLANPTVLRLAWLLTKSRARDYSYLLRVACTLSGGRAAT